jgi:hypothetical protein
MLAMLATELDVRYRDRRAATIQNDEVRVTVLREGGHIAEIFDKATGINPLWVPPWRSIEPSEYSAATHPEFGSGSNARLLETVANLASFDRPIGWTQHVTLGPHFLVTKVRVPTARRHSAV